MQYVLFKLNEIISLWKLKKAGEFYHKTKKYQKNKEKAIETFNNNFKAFEENPMVDIITVMFHASDFGKLYPNYAFDLNNSPKGYYVTSFEIAFRLNRVKGRIKMNIKFHQMSFIYISYYPIKLGL